LWLFTHPRMILKKKKYNLIKIIPFYCDWTFASCMPSLQILLPSQLFIVSITSVNFTHVFALLDARLLEHSNSNPKGTHLLLSSSYLSFCSSSFFLLQKWRLMMREIFERGGGEAEARAICGQAGEHVTVVIRLLLSDCGGKL